MKQLQNYFVILAQKTGLVPPRGAARPVLLIYKLSHKHRGRQNRSPKAIFIAFG